MPALPEFRDWIRSKGCLVCGRPAEAHHVRTRGAIGEEDVCNLVPLCSHHHTGGAGIHFKGRKTFGRTHRLCLPGIAITLYAEWCSKGRPATSFDLAY